MAPFTLRLAEEEREKEKQASIAAAKTGGFTLTLAPEEKENITPLQQQVSSAMGVEEAEEEPEEKT